MFGSCIVESCFVCYKISQLAGQQVHNIQSEESQQKSERPSRIRNSFCLAVFLFFPHFTVNHTPPGFVQEVWIRLLDQITKNALCSKFMPQKSIFFLAAGQGSMWQNLCAAACLLIGLIGTVWAELFIYCKDQTPLSPLTNFSPAGFYSSVWWPKIKDLLQNQTFKVEEKRHEPVLAQKKPNHYTLSPIFR